MTVHDCIVRIINNLSGAARRFYEREFSFFKKVTDISGIIRYTSSFTASPHVLLILRPYPKPERKEQCLKALKEVTLEPGNLHSVGLALL